MHAWSVGDLSPAEQAAWSFLFALDLALAPRRTDGFAWDDRVLGWLKSFLLQLFSVGPVPYRFVGDAFQNIDSKMPQLHS